MEPEYNGLEVADRSRQLLHGLLEILESIDDGQARLDRITDRITTILQTDVCSVYLLRTADSLELCATQGLNPQAVHVTRMHMGEGLVGRVAQELIPINTANAPTEPGFRYMPETGEEMYASFLGVPILQRGTSLGVLVVQSRESRRFSEAETQILKVVASALADMTELGKFVSDQYAISAPHTRPAQFQGSIGQEGIAEGQVLLHESRVVVANPITDDPEKEILRLNGALEKLRGQVDEMTATSTLNATEEQRAIIETYRMFANSRGWVQRMEANIRSGLSAEASVEKEQSDTRTRMSRAEPYLRDRLHDLDDLSIRLLRLLTGQARLDRQKIPRNPILVARQIGTGELIEYGAKLKAVVLEEGSVGSHAAIIARANAIPLLVHTEGILSEALNGDPILVDGDSGTAYLRPSQKIAITVRNKIAQRKQLELRYQGLRDLPAISRDGVTISLNINAGLLPHLPNFGRSGADGVGLFRTELKFLANNRMPRREELVEYYRLVLDSAKGCPVCFRTLDIGSDKLLRYMKRDEEPNPAMGWRAIRVGLDRPYVLKMQLQALVRAANGRPLSVMFPLVAETSEFEQARTIFLDVIGNETARNRAISSDLKIGAMLETPSLAFAPDRFFRQVDYLSIGGNDLQQFFFAADRQNELVRRRYGTLNISYLRFVRFIVERCAKFDVMLSYCGEAAGRPLEAVCLAAIGLRRLSMRALSVGSTKHLIRHSDLSAVRAVIEAAETDGTEDLRTRLANEIGVEHILTP